MFVSPLASVRERAKPAALDPGTSIWTIVLELGSTHPFGSDHYSGRFVGDAAPEAEGTVHCGAAHVHICPSWTSSCAIRYPAPARVRSPALWSEQVTGCKARPCVYCSGHVLGRPASPALQAGPREVWGRCPTHNVVTSEVTCVPVGPLAGGPDLCIVTKSTLDVPRVLLDRSPRCAVIVSARGLWGRGWALYGWWRGRVCCLPFTPAVPVHCRECCT